MELEKAFEARYQPPALEDPFDEAVLREHLKGFSERMGADRTEAFIAAVVEKLRQMSSTKIEATQPGFFIGTGQ